MQHPDRRRPAADVARRQDRLAPRIDHGGQRPALAVAVPPPTPRQVGRRRQPAAVVVVVPHRAAQVVARDHDPSVGAADELHRAGIRLETRDDSRPPVDAQPAARVSDLRQAPRPVRAPPRGLPAGDAASPGACRSTGTPCRACPPPAAAPASPRPPAWAGSTATTGSRPPARTCATAAGSRPRGSAGPSPTVRDPGTPRKKSRSTTSSPIRAYSRSISFSVSRAADPPPPSPNTSSGPSYASVFQRLSWFGLMPCRAARSPEPSRLPASPRPPPWA